MAKHLESVVRLDDLLAQDEDFQRFYNLKRNLMSYFDMNLVLDLIRASIAESEFIDFTSARAARHVSVNQPVFSVTIDDKAAYKQYEPRKDFATLQKNQEKLYTFRNTVVTNDVVAKVSTAMFQQFYELKENGKLSDATESLLAEFPENEIEGIFIMNIFRVSIEDTNSENPITNIEYRI